jgi:hypothetical protein
MNFLLTPGFLRSHGDESEMPKGENGFFLGEIYVLGRTRFVQDVIATKRTNSRRIRGGGACDLASSPLARWDKMCNSWCGISRGGRDYTGVGRRTCSQSLRRFRGGRTCSAAAAAARSTVESASLGPSTTTSAAEMFLGRC